MKPSHHPDELCYPFIYEASSLCDFEVVTDELCAIVGAAMAQFPERPADILRDLDQLQPRIFHLNGSIRGRQALTEQDIRWLQSRLDHYRKEIGKPVDGFVLPRGDVPVPQLHQARSAAKKAIRCLVRVEQEGKPIPPELPRFCNLMCNFFFTLTLVINQRRGFAETPFVSKSYEPRRTRDQ
ncbi:MAG: hypothetical protein N2Z69_02145 [Methylophilaceae bacterium]|nr:hypothetical protein [Methylophilaceae bacterium]